MFNPQLDIYQYLKHNRENFPVLVSPLDLYAHHRDGYPWIIGFKDRQRIFSEGLYPYEDTFRKLSAILWPGGATPVRPTSPVHMAEYFTTENKSRTGLIVCPDGRTDRYEKYREQLKDSQAARVKYEADLTKADLGLNLLIQGPLGQYRLDFLRDKPVPVTFNRDRIRIGEFEFPAAGTGFCGCFPNPYNPEHYLYFQLWGDSLKSRLLENYVDYAFYRDGPDGRAEILLHGFFDHSTANWAFSNRLYFGSEAVKTFCRNGICPAPPAPPGGFMTELPGDFSGETPPVPIIAGPAGRDWTLGRGSCRFPSILAGKDGTAWVAWEEEGDMFLAALGDGSGEAWLLERGPSDSYFPVLAPARDGVWIFFLNDQDGFYRLYGRSFQKGALSEPVMLSENEPCDAVAPAAAWTGDGKIAVAWSDWKANQRFPVYRVLENRFLGAIQPIQIKKSDIDYTNAWCISLAYDRHGVLRGAWNQHYPLTLGVYAGTLKEEAAGVHDQQGGYPSAVFDGSGRFWVFWQSARDWRSGTTQVIFGSYFDPDRKQWAMPYTLSNPAAGRWNETPRAALAEDGTMWVVWSGRTRENDPWRIYASKGRGDSWSKPVAVSAEGENARAPVIATGAGGRIWAAWHSGRGKGMRIKVARLDAP